jgi:glutamine amidotransferase-like uncharacterized protein
LGCDLKLIKMKKIKKIKQNGIIFIGLGAGVLSLNELIDFTEPTIWALNIAGSILVALPFRFYLYDGIKALKKNLN